MKDKVKHSMLEDMLWRKIKQGDGAEMTKGGGHRKENAYSGRIARDRRSTGSEGTLEVKKGDRKLGSR